MIFVQAVCRAGARSFNRPIHSPDPNPIGQTRAKLATPLRNVNARSFDDIKTAIRELPSEPTPLECQNLLSLAARTST